MRIGHTRSSRSTISHPRDSRQLTTTRSRTAHTRALGSSAASLLAAERVTRDDAAVHEPTGGAQYDPFAAAFERHAQDSAYNAYYDRPALLDLLGEVSGKRVLDAGCGPGLYAAELARRGARVTGFDESPEMVRLARGRLGVQAEIRRGTLAEPLAWLPDGSQDLVLMALVLHHLDDRVSAIRELHRVLRPGGHLVLSTSHPTSDWLLQGGSYFATELIEETWQRDWRLRY